MPGERGSTDRDIEMRERDRESERRERERPRERAPNWSFETKKQNKTECSKLWNKSSFSLKKNVKRKIG